MNTVKRQMMIALVQQIHADVQKLNDQMRKCAEWGISTELMLDNHADPQTNTFFQEAKPAITLPVL